MAFRFQVRIHLKNQVNSYLWSTEMLNKGLHDICLILNTILALKSGATITICLNICVWNK